MAGGGTVGTAVVVGWGTVVAAGGTEDGGGLETGPCGPVVACGAGGEGAVAARVSAGFAGGSGSWVLVAGGDDAVPPATAAWALGTGLAPGTEG